MSLVKRLRIPFPTTNQLIISILIAGLGWLSGQALSQIDQDLRIMYTEYTLGAADLAHISADVMRYRNTIIRSLEADSRKDFERITESLPTQRARIQHAVDRYAAAGLRVSRSGRSEEKDIQAVRESLDQYFSAASKTIQLLTMQWGASSQQEAVDLRRKAELHAADWEKAFGFYSGLFGWVKHDAVPMGEMGTYQTVGLADAAFAGMFNGHEPAPRPYWLYYFGVDDIDAAGERVKDGGGQVLMGPMEVPGGAFVINATDPQGGMFALLGPKA